MIIINKNIVNCPSPACQKQKKNAIFYCFFCQTSDYIPTLGNWVSFHSLRSDDWPSVTHHAHFMRICDGQSWQNQAFVWTISGNNKNRSKLIHFKILPWINQSSASYFCRALTELKWMWGRHRAIIMAISISDIQNIHICYELRCSSQEPFRSFILLCW